MGCYVRLVLLAAIVVLSPAASAVAQTSAIDSSSDPAAVRVDVDRSRVDELIKQLGSPVYIARRAAEIELAKIGLPAFDQVLAATESPDPEVAATAGYLLSKIAIEWSSPDDPPAVRRELQGYGSKAARDRENTVDQIASYMKVDTVGVRVVAALCRVARFDPAPSVSRRAAGAVLECETLAIPGELFDAVRQAQQRFDEQHGPSTRPASQWLDRFAKQPNQPATEALAGWRRLAELETKRLTKDDARSNVQAVIAIEWNVLRLQLAEGGGGAAATVGRLIRLTEDNAGVMQGEEQLDHAFDWLLEAEANEAIDEVIAARELEMATKRGRYQLAKIRKRQGRVEEAERLAAAALATPYVEALRVRRNTVIDGDLLLAVRLYLDSHADWACDEFRKMIESGQAMSQRTVSVQHALMNVLQDAARYDEAVEVLESLLKQIAAGSKRDYQQLDKNHPDTFFVLDILPQKELDSRMHYCRALARRAEGDEQAARESLELAFDGDPGNADILIAMYRSKDATKEYRRKVLRSIRELADRFEAEIEAEPSNGMPLNQWAWLVGNTEGDYQRAIEYSERSLKISPGAAGYLDTLGRCYFSAGRIEDAVRVQREAIAKAPYFQVMKRQLEEFEAALDGKEQGAKEPGFEASDSSDP